MALPQHQYASVSLAADPGTVLRRLLRDPQAMVEWATADTLHVMGPHVTRWGLRPSELPTTSANATGSEEFGCVEVLWGGSEDATGWPALPGRLVVAASPAGGSRLLFFSPRSPDSEVATARLGSLHRRRLVHVTVQRFLRDLGRHLEGADARGPRVAPTTFDRTPMFVHHLREVGAEPAAVLDALTSDLRRLAERSTRSAVADAAALLRAGGFRSPAAPSLRARLAAEGEPATVWLGWQADEEETGWPRLDIAVLVEAHEAGSRLVLLATREPGYDLSRPRVDKGQRDQILRSATAAVGEAIAEHVVGGDPAPTPAHGRGLVAAGH